MVQFEQREQNLHRLGGLHAGPAWVAGQMCKLQCGANHSGTQHFGKALQRHLCGKLVLKIIPMESFYLIFVGMAGHPLPMGAQKGERVPVRERQRFDGTFQLVHVLGNHRLVELFEGGEGDQRFLQKMVPSSLNSS
jgi:hypothetical protein